MDALVVRGKTQNEQVASINHALRALARRMSRHTRVVIPPQILPVAKFDQEAQILLPCRGRLRTAHFSLNIPVTRIVLTLEVGTIGTTLDFITNKEYEECSLNWEVNAPGILHIYSESPSAIQAATVIFNPDESFATLNREAAEENEG